MMAQVSIPVSPGELIDKITILEIKQARIIDPSKRANIDRELGLLRQARRAAGLSAQVITTPQQELKAINESLWDIEDRLRAKESQQCFDREFIELARSVYRCNDQRTVLKRAINRELGAEIAEEKCYHAY